MSVLALLHVIVSSSLLLFAFSYNDSKGDIYKKFYSYTEKFNKSYEVGTKEFNKRESIFEQTLHRVEWLNKHRQFPQSAVYGINQFSDLTPEEFKRYVHLKKVENTFKKPLPNKNQLLNNKKIMDTLPTKVDWRDKKCITPVNDQEECGACWAFSIVETIESMYALKKGVLEEWSVQQVVDCATKPNNGCEGGDTCLAIQWMHENKTKLVLAEDYPFTAKTGTCNTKIKTKRTVQIASNFTCDNFIDAEHLMLLHLAYHGPLIVAVDASGWQDYLGGIIQFHCDSERNHAVQIVGYDLTGDVPYYIVRNSWGIKFGKNGYLYIAIGKNMCRIAEEVSSIDVL